MIHSLVVVALMAQPSQVPNTPNGFLVLEVNRKSITLDFHKVKIDQVEEVTGCVYQAWRRGRISHRAAIQTLARLACVDKARVKGRPLSFHGDSWVSTGHWSKVIKDVIHIYNQGTKDPSNYDQFMSKFVEKGLAYRASDSNKYGELIEFEKKPLSGKQIDQLIQWVQDLEKMIGGDVRFEGKEPLDESHPQIECEDSVVIKNLK
jgi:hypothetical protein